MLDGKCSVGIDADVLQLLFYDDVHVLKMGDSPHLHEIKQEGSMLLHLVGLDQADRNTLMRVEQVSASNRGPKLNANS